MTRLAQSGADRSDDDHSDASSREHGAGNRTKRPFSRSIILLMASLLALLGVSCMGDEGPGIGVGGAASDESMAMAPIGVEATDPLATAVTAGGRSASSRSEPMPPSMRAAYIAARQAEAGHDYELARRPDGTLEGRIPPLGLAVEVGQDGVVEVRADQDGPAEREETAWTAGFRFVGLGRDSALAEAPALVRGPALDESGGAATQVRLDREDGVEEWYASGPLGIEQGFTLAERPEGVGELVVAIEIQGLVPELRAGGDEISLRTAAGQRVLRYSDLFARDAAGDVLATRMALAGSTIQLVVDDAEARYPIEIDPLVAAEQAKLTAPDGEQDDMFGESVSVSGDYAVVGVSTDDVDGAADQGSAYVFVRSGSSWSYQARLTKTSGVSDDRFGDAVSIDGDTIVIGAPREAGNIGAAYVYVRSGTTWSPQGGPLGRLSAPDGAAGSYFGSAVSVSGDTAVVGAYSDDFPSNSNQGSAYVFVRNGTSWSYQAKLVATDGAAGDLFGISVAVSADTAIVGAYFDTVGSNAAQGSAYAFVRNGANWTQQDKLTASDGAAQDRFGLSVSISGTTAVVGSHQDDVGTTSNQGSAYVFVRNGSNWTQQDKLTASDGAAQDHFGGGVAVSGDVAVVGAYDEDVDGNFSQGSAYVFVRSGASWSEFDKLVAGDGAAGDELGGAVALSDGTVLVGALRCNVAGHSNQGAAYVFVVGLELADACGSGGECLSGFCADGVCCDSACDVECEACSAAKKGSGNDGECGNIAADSDPDDECGIGPEASCDGAGACKLALAGACSQNDECLSGFCADEVCCDVACDTPCQACTAAKVGSGADGQCGLIPAGDDPDDECGVGEDSSCDGAGACIEETAETCTLPTECLSGFCVDGYCCESACDGTCEACSAALKGTGTNGLCGPVEAGSDPNDECTADSDNDCGADGFCDGTGVCRTLVPAGDSCGASSCSDDGVATTEGQCDGAGTCESDAIACAPYRCTPTGTCLTICSTTADCLPGLTCDASGACVATSGATSAEEGGCGCSVPGRESEARGVGGRGALYGLPLGLGLLAVARRRRKRS